MQAMPVSKSDTITMAWACQNEGIENLSGISKKQHPYQARKALIIDLSSRDGIDKVVYKIINK
jgi:hypothetical protein